MKNSTLKAAAALLLVAALYGCTEKPHYAIPGAGAVTCRAYGNAWSTMRPERDAYVQWVAGYLVARQFSKDRPLRDEQIGGEEWKTTLGTWLEKWCGDRPAASVVDAAAALSDELLGR